MVSNCIKIDLKNSDVGASLNSADLQNIPSSKYCKIILNNVIDDVMQF